MSSACVCPYQITHTQPPQVWATKEGETQSPWWHLCVWIYSWGRKTSATYWNPLACLYSFLVKSCHVQDRTPTFSVTHDRDFTGNKNTLKMETLMCHSTLPGCNEQHIEQIVTSICFPKSVVFQSCVLVLSESLLCFYKCWHVDYQHCIFWAGTYLSSS